jgi:GNAT superfamily N-acetyltransferase
MVYHITKSDITKAAQVLGKSFMNYPIFSYIIPDPTYREKKIKFIFSFLLNLGLLGGEVIAPTSKMEGVSIWIDSSRKESSIIQLLKDGLIPLFLNLDLKSIFRFFSIGIQKQRMRKKILSGPYFMLDVIGTDPSYQNQGFGRLMIESKLKEYDTQPNPCYLETSDKGHIPFYNKYGFQLHHEYQLKEIRVYCLLRDSRSS